MSTKLRKLNEAGLRIFREYVVAGAVGPAPVELLTSNDTSDPVAGNIIVGSGSFSDRFMFGTYLRSLFREHDPAVIANDQGLWSGLALLWFDHLCPSDAAGNRKPDKEYRYLLSSDYRHYYRHLVRTPWQLVKDHGNNAKVLLISPKDQANPLGVHGEILEQIGGRQQVLASKPIIAAANNLYLNPKTDKPHTGVAGSKGGSARRFGMVLRQLDLTYDPACMDQDGLLGILPKEFDRWKKTSSSGKLPDINSSTVQSA